MKNVLIGAALSLAMSSSAYAIDVQAGNWTVSVSGDIDGFGSFTRCGHNSAKVGGGLACNTAVDTPHTFNLQSGLLPSALVFSVKTRQSNLDVTGTVGFYPGIGSQNLGAGGAANHSALGVSLIDLRQNFLTFGDASWGTIKIGRDLGFFGGDAILSDMTLFGMGSLAFAGLYVSIGHIGTGYIYADWIPQISYTSPKLAGFQLAIGAFQPLNNVSFSGSANTVAMTNHETPMGQFKLSYDWKGTVGGKVWISGLVQDQKTATGDGVTIGGGDLGLKLNVLGFDLLGYAYIASGVGTTGIGFDGIATTAHGLEGRGSWGYFTQLTYKYWKIKPGISYGESRLNLADDEGASDLVRRNRSLVGGLYFGITDNLTLTAEYVRTWSANHDGPGHPGGEIADNMWALGGILFF